VYDLGHLTLAIDYLERLDERTFYIGELALVYSVLPDLLPDLIDGSLVVTVRG